MNIINAYTLQANLYEEYKKNFWEVLDELVRGIRHADKLSEEEISMDTSGQLRGL